MGSEELCFLNAAELGPLIRGREVSPVDLVEALLARIGERNSSLVAYVHVSGDRAMAAARAAEIEIGAGGYRGPLHGIPVAYKDIIHVQGLPTTANSRVMLDYVASQDSTVAAKLRRAGAICMGKLNTNEFASGSHEVLGEPRNPWNTETSPGGSSSGSGVAEAAHLLTVSVGQDTGGSIRVPSSICGVVGLKPTYGRVSRAGSIPLSWSLDHIGPMSRTVADTAILLHEMAGPDPRDPSAEGKVVPDYQAMLGGDLRGMRLGVPRSYFFDGVDHEIATSVRVAIEVMRQLGAAIMEVDLPHAQYGPAASWTIAYTEGYAIHRANFLSRPRDYTLPFVHKMASAACLTVEERITADRVRQVITSEFLEALRNVDAIVTPTTPYPAWRVGQWYPGGDPGRCTRPVSLAGLPALAVPCGFNSTGLPMSMQLVGRAWDEGTVLRIGHAYEQAAGWYRQRAPLTANGEAVGATEAPTSSTSGDGGLVDAHWVLEWARLSGLSFITESDAGPIAAMVAPLKAQLAAARERMDAGVEPPVRPVMV